MKTLYLVPIIHSPADMGTLADAISESSSDALGRELWARHRQTVSLFWEVIARFFNSPEIKITQIYQDGLVVDGKDGLNIIQEGARRGSSNYQIVSDLIGRGAVLVKTEDLALVQKEYNFIRKLIQAKSILERETAASRYQRAQGELLDQRDRFIARAIIDALTPTDRGVLFIGAYHEITSKLPADIHVIQVKEIGKVREYHQRLKNFNPENETKYRELAAYLASPVSIPQAKLEA